MIARCTVLLLYCYVRSSNQIDMLSKLEPALKAHLPQASKIFIATALINEYGYGVITNNLPKDCVLKMLIGIDLPTDAGVLRKVFAGENPLSHQSRIYNGGPYFHPKVYLIQNAADGIFRAFVGSANTTAGGLSGNVEMSTETMDPSQCAALLKWFEEHWQKGDELTEEFLEGYSKSVKLIRRRERSNRAQVSDLRKLLKKPVFEGNTSVTPVVAVPATQFFQSSDFEAYAVVNELDHGPVANQRRKAVRERFKTLDNRIFPKFKDYGLTDLYQHSHPASRVSNYFYRPGFTRREMRSMWLHYGYGEHERNDKFGDHPRLQVILHHHDIGVWLVVGKDHGSYFERTRFKDKLLNDGNFREYVYRIFQDIADFTLVVNGVPRRVSDFADSAALSGFFAGDELNQYLMVRREFPPGDPDIADHAIDETILQDFARLYPLFLIFKSFRLI